MQFHKHLYYGKGIKNKYKVLWKLKHGAGMKDIYVIAISGGNDQLDCIHCCFLKQKELRKNIGLVVGVAKGREEMLALLQKMFEDCLKATGAANIKEYLLGKAA